MANDGGPAPWTGSVAVALSLVLHAATFAALGSFRIEPAEVREPPVEISVVESPPPAPVAPAEPEPETPPAPTPEPPPPPPPKLRVREHAPKPVQAPPEQPENTPPAPAEETIADFSGTTLTGEAAGGWVTAIGSGGPMNGPIGRPGAAVTGRDRGGVAGGVIGGAGIRVVPLSNLSRKPKLPSQDVLNKALERHYPKAARQQGIEGTARIKLRVLANGKLEPTRKDNESYPGFGDACLKAIREVALEHRAEPPLDSTGQPAATEIAFSCTFTVD